jgi:hypothetical protein
MAFSRSRTLMSTVTSTVAPGTDLSTEFSVAII